MKNNTRALRRYKTECYQHRQIKIAQLWDNTDLPGGYYKKQAAMDCGNPQCFMCGNYRRNNSTKSRTRSEHRQVLNMHDGLDEYYAPVAQLAEALGSNPR